MLAIVLVALPAVCVLVLTIILIRGRRKAEEEERRRRAETIKQRLQEDSARLRISREVPIRLGPVRESETQRVGKAS